MLLHTKHNLISEIVCRLVVYILATKQQTTKQINSNYERYTYRYKRTWRKNS